MRRNSLRKFCNFIIFKIANILIVRNGIYINDKCFIHSSGSVKINSLSNSSEYFSENLKSMKNQIFRLSSYVK